LFLAPRGTALEPQKDLNAANAWGLQGKWQICSPDTLGGRWGWNGFSAAAYYFAHELQPAIGRPVGVIETAWGGTPAQSWVSLSGLQKEPVLDHYVQDYQKFLANYDPAKVAAFPKIQAAYDTAIARWNQQVAPAFNQAMDEWKAASARAVASGQPAPPQPKPSEPKPTRPVSPDGGPYAPSALFNGMVAPLIPFAIKGVIWYQGESNSGKAKEYATLFPRLITDWREKWNQGDFPFLFVQLPNYIPKPNEGPFVQLREAQSQTLSLPNTGMAVTIDIGNPFDIHPRDKLDVGHRLALVARHVAYGENLVYSGPTYQGMSVEGNKIRLTLQNLGTGLTMGIPPWTPNGAPPLPATTLNGFTIAGSDQKWVEGTAVIEGDSIVVSSSQVPSPLAVRYDWANNPSGNLYNKEALPAAPFRTDTWDLIPLKN
jgi:sialate O-acetylesterase